MGYQEKLLNGLSPDVIQMLIDNKIIKSLTEKDIKKGFVTWIHENKLENSEKKE